MFGPTSTIDTILIINNWRSFVNRHPKYGGKYQWFQFLVDHRCGAPVTFIWWSPFIYILFCWVNSNSAQTQSKSIVLQYSVLFTRCDLWICTHTAWCCHWLRRWDHYGLFIACKCVWITRDSHLPTCLLSCVDDTNWLSNIKLFVFAE